jgi:hypothetical protein
VTDGLRIVVAGGMGAMPFAGVTWQLLHYLEGFRRLGHDVFYLEDTQRWPYDPVNETVCDDAAPAIAYVQAEMKKHEFDWAYRDVASQEVYGTTEASLQNVLASADVLVNVSGVMVLRDEHLSVPLRVYLETDPVLPQIEIAQGKEFTTELLAAHTHHLTYGENFGAPDCEVPVERFDYRPTRQPVVLDWWHSSSPPTKQAFTTVANWHQTSKDIEWNGRVLTWSKDVQFMRFLELPSRVDAALELALASDDDAAIRRLKDAGWQVRPAGAL